MRKSNQSESYLSYSYSFKNVSSRPMKYDSQVGFLSLKSVGLDS